VRHKELAACREHPKAPTSPIAWLIYVVVAIAGGLLLLGIDAVIYGIKRGHVMLDVFLAMVGVVIALSGAIRSLVRREK